MISIGTSKIIRYRAPSSRYYEYFANSGNCYYNSPEVSTATLEEFLEMLLEEECAEAMNMYFIVKRLAHG